eukprot:2880691-Pyramimonas_sp.AAC.1
MQNELGKAQDKLSWRKTQPYAAVNIAIMNIIFARAPYGATNRAKGVSKCVAVYTKRAKTI